MRAKTVRRCCIVELVVVGVLVVCSPVVEEVVLGRATDVMVNDSAVVCWATVEVDWTVVDWTAVVVT